MKPTAFTYLTALILSSAALAHDEGHGPKITDAPEKGGVAVSAVIDPKGDKKTVLYKAELSRVAETSPQSSEFRVYLFEQQGDSKVQLKGDALAPFGDQAKGVLEYKDKKKKWVRTAFELMRDGDSYVGKVEVKRKPYNIDVHLKKDKKELLTAFDGLD